MQTSTYKIGRAEAVFYILLGKGMGLFGRVEDGGGVGESYGRCLRISFLSVKVMER